MKKILTLLTFLLMAAALPVQAVSLADITVPETIQVGDDALLLNGSGLRKKLFLKLYLGALYLKKKSTDAQAILAADEPMAIHLHILSRFVTARKMQKAIKEGFAASTGGNTAPVDEEIQQFLALFGDGVSEDDIFEIIHDPDKGITVSLNGRMIGEIGGHRKAFKQALFGIWLGEKPVQEDLKKGMLGL